MERIARMYAAIGSTAETELEIFQTYLEMHPDAFRLDIKFGGDQSQAQLKNLVFSAIHNTSMFFDHCKEWAKDPTNGISVDEVMAVTDASEELKIIRFLDNKDKHSEKRSANFLPVLEDVSCRLIARDSFSMTHYLNGDVKFEGDMGHVVCGIVRNSVNQVILGDVHDILVTGVNAWEQFLTENGLLPTDMADSSEVGKRSLMFSAPPRKPLPPESPLESVHYLLVLNLIHNESRDFCVTALHLYTVSRTRDVINELTLVSETFVEFRGPTANIGNIALFEAVMTTRNIAQVAGVRIGIYSAGRFEKEIGDRIKPIINDVILPAGFTFISPSDDQKYNNTVLSIDKECEQKAFRMFNAVIGRPEDPNDRNLSGQKLPYRYSRNWFSTPDLQASNGYILNPTPVTETPPAGGAP